MNALRLSFFGIVAAALVAAARAGDEPKPASGEPRITIVIGTGSARAIPTKEGSARTGGGNIGVSQPTPDTLWVTMTGATASKAHPCKSSSAALAFDLCQEFEVTTATNTKRIRLVMWGRAVGMLRNPDKRDLSIANAEVSSPGRAVVICGDAELISCAMPAHETAGGQSVSVYDRVGPVWASVPPGKYSLRQTFGLNATCAKGFTSGRPVSAEFAPGETLSADWLGKREPFHGAVKEEFGFQIVIKVMPEE